MVLMCGVQSRSLLVPGVDWGFSTCRFPQGKEKSFLLHHVFCHFSPLVEGPQHIRNLASTVQYQLVGNAARLPNSGVPDLKNFLDQVVQPFLIESSKLPPCRATHNYRIGRQARHLGRARFFWT